jgi:hypothetical protein
MMDMRRAASVAAVVLGVLLILGGGATWIMVSTTLAEQRIVTPDDACLPGRTVSGPFTAYCQAEVIQRHALEATGGLTFAEMERADPRREVAMNASFLQASLFTSIVAFGIAAMATGMGVLFVLIGLGIRDVRQQIEQLRGAPPER